MKKNFLAIALLLSIFSVAQNNTIKYMVDSASVEHAGIPKGELLKFTFDHSNIFPGTTRDYWIYIPAQYKPEQPACLYVNQDGIQWKAPTVFDNLIYNKEMPVTIGVFVTPGVVMTANRDKAQDRYNRSFEYDGLGDAYGRFLMNELLPEVEKKTTGDGRPIRISKNGNDRAIGGSSSGAVCAFTAAWEHPESFSRVFSAIGTYVGLRGADRYPTLIRKYEPKPIRVFLQDGNNDLNIYGGDWWMANQAMERALSFAGYEVEHVWGEDGHNGNHGTAIFPQAMRWLWKDWPKKVEAGRSKNDYLSQLLIPGQDWELVGEGYQFTEGTATNAAGEVFFADIPNSKLYKLDAQGKPVAQNIDSKKASAVSFGTNGLFYTAANATNQIIAYDKNNTAKVVADSMVNNDIVVAYNGKAYITAPNGTNSGKLYLLKPNGEKKVVDEGLKFPNGVALSPDQEWLYATESASHWVWVYKIMPDGSLGMKQKLGWLHVPDNEENAWSDGIKCDTTGRVFVATRIGIQVLDPIGRVEAIIPMPPNRGQASNLCFGGPNFDEMYVSYVDKVYRRKLNTRGANSFEAPMKPSRPRL